MTTEKMSKEQAKDVLRYIEYGYEGDEVRVDNVEIDETGLQKGKGVWISKHFDNRDVSVASDTKNGKKLILEAGKTYPRNIFVPELYASIGFDTTNFKNTLDLVVHDLNIE